jgi:hypothetical protein
MRNLWRDSDDEHRCDWAGRQAANVHRQNRNTGELYDGDEPFENFPMVPLITQPLVPLITQPLEPSSTQSRVRTSPQDLSRRAPATNATRRQARAAYCILNNQIRRRQLQQSWPNARDLCCVQDSWDRYDTTEHNLLALAHMTFKLAHFGVQLCYTVLTLLQCFMSHPLGTFTL